MRLKFDFDSSLTCFIIWVQRKENVKIVFRKKKKKSEFFVWFKFVQSGIFGGKKFRKFRWNSKEFL
jgi:hypothetical protein